MKNNISQVVYVAFIYLLIIISIATKDYVKIYCFVYHWIYKSKFFYK